jgi:hypothetical protein
MVARPHPGADVVGILSQKRRRRTADAKTAENADPPVRAQLKAGQPSATSHGYREQAAAGADIVLLIGVPEPRNLRGLFNKAVEYVSHSVSIRHRAGNRCYAAVTPASFPACPASCFFW